MNIEPLEYYQNNLSKLAEEHFKNPTDELTKKLSNQWKEFQTHFPKESSEYKMPYHNIIFQKTNPETKLITEFIVNRIGKKKDMDFIDGAIFFEQKLNNQMNLNNLGYLGSVNDRAMEDFCRYENTGVLPDIQRYYTDDLVSLFLLSHYLQVPGLEELVLSKRYFVLIEKEDSPDILHFTPKADLDAILDCQYPFISCSLSEFYTGRGEEKWFLERLTQLSQQPNVQSIDLEITNCTDSFLKEICSVEFSNLSELKLNMGDYQGTRPQRVTDKGMQSIGKLKSLTKLELPNCNITIEGLKELEQLENLTSLDITRCAKIPLKEASDMLKKFKNLEWAIGGNTRVL